MRSDSFAEWILCRCTNRERAASVVGDLVELREQTGLLWFWLSLAGAVVRLLWRPALALVAAFYASNWAFSIFQMSLWGAHADHHVTGGARAAFLFGILNTAGASLYLVFVYSTLRYSVLDAPTQLAAAFTLLATGLVYLWWQPVALLVLLTLLVVVPAAPRYHGLRRQGLIPVLTAVLVSCFGFLLSVLLSTAWQKFLSPGPWKEMHRSTGWLAFFLMLITAWLTTATYSALRNYFANRHSLADPSRLDIPSPS